MTVSLRSSALRGDFLPFCDSLTLPQLPPEIWDKIFGLLKNEDRIRLPLVCKRWDAFTPEKMRLSKRIRPVDFTEAANMATQYKAVSSLSLPFALLKHVQHLQAFLRLRSLVVTEISMQNLALLNQFLSAEAPFKKSLLKLRLCKAQNSSFISLDIKKLQIECFNHLKEFIHLEVVDVLPGERFFSMLQALPLRKIGFYGCVDQDIAVLSTLTGITSLRILGETNLLAVPSLGTLTHLAKLKLECFSNLRSKFPYVEKLCLENASFPLVLSTLNCFPHAVTKITSISSLSLIHRSDELVNLCKKDSTTAVQVFKHIISRALLSMEKVDWREILDELVSMGVDINVWNQEKRMPFWFCLFIDKGKDILEYLLAKGLNVHVCDASGASALHYIAREPGNYQYGLVFFEQLVGEIDVMQKDFWGNTALSEALKTGKFALALRILDRCENPLLECFHDKVMIDGLLTAPQNNFIGYDHYEEVFKKLIAGAVDLNALRRNGASFYDSAVKNKSLVALKAACVFNIKPTNESVYEDLCSRNFGMLLSIVLRYQRPEFRPSLEKLMFLVAAKGDAAQMKDLKEAGVQWNIENEAGEKAWQVAKRYGNKEVESYLLHLQREQG